MTQQERSRKARQKWRGLISEQARSGQGVAAFWAGGPGSGVVDITVGERITLRHVSRE